MKNKKLLMLVLFLAVFSLKANAQDICSKSGYTVLTINGIFTDKNGAQTNALALKRKLSPTYKDQAILVDYVYNATHFGGALDLVDAVRQGLFDPKIDYDLVEILDSASDKVTTQKVLLVGHSQGNFYANSFYNNVADIKGGVPSQSIGVYSVATPDNHVAGNGKYLTSDTDSVIATIVGRLKTIMKPNTHIELQKGDGNGHDFSNVYLKYRSAEIVSNIKSSFDKLETNSIQNENVACIFPQKISILHDFTGVLLAATDFVVSSGVKVATLNFNITNKAANSIVNTLVKIAKGGMAAVGLANNKEIAPVVVALAPAIVVEADEPIIIAIDTPSEIIIDDTKIDDPIIITNPIDPLIVPETIAPESEPHSHNSSGNNDVVVPEDAISEIVVPEVAIPEIIIPEVVIPEIVVPEIATSEIIVPDIIVSEVATSEIIIPDIIAPVINLIGANPLYLSSEKNWPYIENGATALDEKDGSIDVVVSGKIDKNIRTIQTLTYTATDKAGNISIKTRDVKYSDRIYIGKYTFGTGNGDGNNWQIWSFNGSYVYGWSDTYVNKYLREEFTIESQKNQMWCSACLMRGIFKDDPRKGFGVWDFDSSALENNPQSNHTGFIYQVSIQWDSTGYITTISRDGIIESVKDVDLPNMNNNLWVGWDAMTNNFKTFPAGYWYGVKTNSITGFIGGTDMTLTPFSIYDENAEDTTPITPPVVIIPTLSSEKLVTSFSFNSLDPKVNGVIDDINHTISLTVPYETDVNNLIPTIVISDKATISEASLLTQDFTNPITYIVEAEDKTNTSYVVTVTISALPIVVIPPIINEDDILPTVTDYSINGWHGGLQLNPITNNLNIIITASKKVDWISLKIEKISDIKIYKIFYSNSTTCIDGTKTCAKVWLGDLSGGGLLQNGEYRIKVHMKDNLGNEYEDYLGMSMNIYGGV